jgi:hypothetical protein
MAKLKNDCTYKKSSTEGRQAAGGKIKPKTTTKKMSDSLKNKGGLGKKI